MPSSRRPGCIAVKKVLQELPKKPLKQESVRSGAFAHLQPNTRSYNCHTRCILECPRGLWRPMRRQRRRLPHCLVWQLFPALVSCAWKSQMALIALRAKNLKIGWTPGSLEAGRPGMQSDHRLSSRCSNLLQHKPPRFPHQSRLQEQTLLVQTAKHSRQPRWRWSARPQKNSSTRSGKSPWPHRPVVARKFRRSHQMSLPGDWIRR